MDKLTCSKSCGCDPSLSDLKVVYESPLVCSAVLNVCKNNPVNHNGTGEIKNEDDICLCQSQKTDEKKHLTENDNMNIMLD